MAAKFLQQLMRKSSFAGLAALLSASLVLSACQPQPASLSTREPANQEIETTQPDSTRAPNSDLSIPTPFPTRSLYSPGELVDYIAQTGDTLPQLAARFNTSVAEILQANSFIPPSATTMPPGMPMKIPIYYRPLWGSPYQILPDGLFINGPAQGSFNTSQFIADQPGWLKDEVEYAAEKNRSAAEVVEYVALKFSVSPRLLLALLEYQAGALSQPQASKQVKEFPLGYKSWDHKGLYLQLVWAADRLNHGYYSYRNAHMLSIERRDERLERIDPWQNAATASLHYYFNNMYDSPQYDKAISAEGFAHTYQALFGDPWQDPQSHIPGSLEQPEFILPFEPGSTWAYTGGPHTAWGKGEPYAALDFAPPSVAGGCLLSSEWVTAIASGRVVRSEVGEVVIDIDGDGDERTGWNIFYLHLGSDGRAQLGDQLKQGDPVGHPSCEGGTSTGTHVHLARKYNGEWITAEGIQGVLAFNMEGWVPHDGSQPYLGTLTRNAQIVVASICSNAKSFIASDRQ
jgi:LasA protease